MKYEALLELEKGKTNKKVSKLFNVDFDITADELVDIDLDVCITNKSNHQMRISLQRFLHMTLLTLKRNQMKRKFSDYVTKPSFNDAMDAITLLENYQSHYKFGADLMKALEEINRVVDIDSKSNKRQSIITDFLA